MTKKNRVKIFVPGTHENYLQENLTREYFHTRKFPDLRYTYFSLVNYVLIMEMYIVKLIIEAVIVALMK